MKNPYLIARLNTEDLPANIAVEIEGIKDKSDNWDVDLYDIFEDNDKLIYKAALKHLNEGWTPPEMKVTVIGSKPAPKKPTVKPAPSVKKSPLAKYEKIYANLLVVFPDLKDVTKDDVFDDYAPYISKEIKGYDRFSAEINMLDDSGRLVLDLSQTYMQNGDLMSAPRMQVAIDNKRKIAEALNYEAHNTIPQVYAEVYPEPGQVNLKEKKSQNDFLLTWTKNLINQGFKDIELLELTHADLDDPIFDDVGGKYGDTPPKAPAKKTPKQQDFKIIKRGLYEIDGVTVDLTKTSISTDHPLAVVDDNAPQFKSILRSFIAKRKFKPGDAVIANGNQDSIYTIIGIADMYDYRDPENVWSIKGGFNSIAEANEGDLKLSTAIGADAYIASGRKPSSALAKSKYSGVFGDYDNDGLLNVDDPNPTKKGDKETVEEVKLSDEIAALIQYRDSQDDIRKEFVAIVEKVAQGEEGVYSRTKTPFSIINKMRRKRLISKIDPNTGQLEQGNQGLTDVIGAMVVFDTQAQLEKFKKQVKAGDVGKVLEFNDYYATQHAGYKAYHFDLVFKGAPVELQLKTLRMKKIAAANHELYKTGAGKPEYLEALTQVMEMADAGDTGAANLIDPIINDKAKLNEYLTRTKIEVPKLGVKAKAGSKGWMASEVTKGKRGDYKHFTMEQVLAHAQKFERARSRSGQTRDEGSDSKKRLSPTPENLVRWMNNPGGFDLIGVDTFKKDDATSNLRIKLDVWWNSVG